MESGQTSATAKVGYAETLIGSYPGTPEAKRASELLDKLKADLAEEARGRQWAYSAQEDGMSGKQTFSGSVTSTNSFEFDFPYQGQQNAKLTLRRHPRWGNDVIFSIEKGQILCHTYQCAVRVRFDEGAPQTFSGTGPADNSSESVFIPAYGTFAKKLEKAKRVRVEVNIYQHGVLVSDFDVEGFKQEKLRAPK